MSKANARRAGILASRRLNSGDEDELTPEEKERQGDRALQYQYVI